MNTLVTGGAGFIGSHLVDRLLVGGYRVTVLDNFSTGRRANLSHCLNHPMLSLVEADVTSYDDIEGYFRDIDHVYHLAALADIIPSVQRPVDYFRANVDGTFAVLEAARNNCVGRLIYAASSSCYGIPDTHPTSETAAIKPEYPYAMTKYIGEELVLHWCKVYKLPVVALRFFNVYGPRSRTSGTYGAVLGVFLAQKLANEPFTVVGDGTQTRDFTYVTDVAEACVSAAESDLVGDIMNVGSGGTYSINRLVELLGGPTVHIPRRPGEPDCTFANIDRIKATLGWHPQVAFEEGVRMVLDEIDYWRDAPVWTPKKIAEETSYWHQLLDPKKKGSTRV